MVELNFATTEGERTERTKENNQIYNQRKNSATPPINLIWAIMVWMNIYFVCVQKGIFKLIASD